MAELKNLTVQALRELARKALGRGHSRLKTKSELVAALQAAGRSVSAKAAARVASVKAATGRAAAAAGKAVESARRSRKPSPKKAPRKAAVKAAAGAEEKAAAGAKEKAAPRTEKAAPRAEEKAAPGRPAKAPPPAEAHPRREARPTEPDPESYFVSRVAGEDAVRDAPHPMTESALEQRAATAEPRRAGRRRAFAYEEDLGDLPWRYEDDTFVALPRDPRTLFVYWDHHGETLSNGLHGLEGPRAQLWVLAQGAGGGWERVRVLDFALESRGWYVHDLEPGRVYRAEIHLVDRAGRDRLLQGTSNEMQLPPAGPSAVIADRFLRLPWGTPLARLLRHYREGGPFPEELRAVLAHLSDWRRFVGPTLGSGSAAGPGGRAGPGESSPSSPFGPLAGRGGLDEEDR